MAEGKNTWVFDLDVKEALRKLNDFKGGVESVGDEKNLSGLINSFSKIAGVAAVAGTAIFAIKATMDAVFEGENIKAINQQFDILSKNAGIVGESLKDGMMKAAGGLADDEDVMQAANQAIVKMGDNAKQLPEIMELARKSSAVFGGELVQNFEGLSNAIANGNQRALKQYGIVVDVEKAVRDYAKSIGSTASALSESGRQQAIMNAVLEKGKSSFDGVDVNIKKNQNTMKELMVTLGQIKEVFIVVFEQTVGPALHAVLTGFKNLANGVKESLTVLNSAWGENAEVTEMQIKKQKEKIADLVSGLATIEEQASRTKAASWIKEAQKRRQEIDILEAELGGLIARRKMLKAESEEAEKEAASSGTVAPKVDLEKQARQQSEFEKSLLSMQQQRLQLEEQNATNIETVNEIHHQKLLAIADEYNRQLKDIDAQRQMGKITEQQAVMMQEETALITQQKILAHDDNLEKKRLASLERFAERNKETSKGFSAAWAVETQKAVNTANNFALRGQFVFSTLNKQAVQMFKSIGDGSKNAGEAMKSFMLGSLGEIATREGEVMLAKGIGMYDPIQIAQGGTLIALGALISSQAGGGAVSAGGGGGGGVGGGAMPGGAMDQTKPDVKEPKKSVTVQVMGSYFETDQTKTRLMEMIRESSDATDFSFRQVGQ